MYRLAIPFVVAVGLVLVGGAFDDNGTRNLFGWLAIVSFGIGVVLVCVFTLTRFVGWAARR